ncbi:TetR/AcrR family transcriptional regulator [Streptomyces sp. SID13726]|uniref:TetR/AcrR family transcriptional regulator n=1 Tax=Streptomyces sp. SID13726 TaxID=2706058 RepID=UPI0013B89FFD|nr:TetR/AcrR family transcriptional regulator [Streptomyces sp. SID13726]NEA98755.1 TetR/AcrR family transcriptional regulator [Streptomyces sp. SID13726]
MKTRPYHHGDLRAALLTLAEQTLRENGPGAVSLRELAREAGVSPAAPSRHFKGKQALLDALALEGFDRLTVELGGALERAGDSFGDRMAAVMRAYLGFATANAALHDLMYEFKYAPSTSAELAEARQRLGNLTAELVEEGQRRGEVRADPLDSVTLPLTATLQGFAALVVGGAIPADRIERSLDDTIAFVLRGYAP